MDDRTLELLSASMDGELTAEEQAEVDRILASSEEARRWLEGARADEARLKAQPVLKAPPLKPRPVEKRRSWMPMLKAASVAILAGGAVWYALTREPRLVELAAADLGRALGGGTPAAQRFEVARGDYREGGSTRFRVALDGEREAAGRAELQLSYDFQGDGRTDRKESYGPLTLDAKRGWELFNERSAPVKVEGEDLRDFEHGLVHVAVWCLDDGHAIRVTDVRITLPHR